MRIMQSLCRHDSSASQFTARAAKPVLVAGRFHSQDAHSAERTSTMAIFYVLPSRHILGQRFSEVLTSLFPYARNTSWDWPDLAESIAGLVEAQGGAHV